MEAGIMPGLWGEGKGKFHPAIFLGEILSVWQVKSGNPDLTRTCLKIDVQR